MGLEATQTNREITAFVNQPIQSSAYYGGTGGGGYSYVLGNFVTALQTYSTTANGQVLSAISLTFDNGDTALIGSKTGAASTVLNLAADSISKMYVQTTKNSTAFGGNNLGISALYIETVHGIKFASSSQTPAQNPGSWTLVANVKDNNPCQNIVLLGFTGLSGMYVDGFTCWYKEDVLTNRVVDTFNYSGLTSTPSTPINVSSATLANQTTTTQQMSITFEKSVSSSYTWSIGTGVTIGTSAAFKTGVPFVAKGEVTVSAEISFNASFGETHTTSESFAYSANVSVPAGGQVTANAVASSYSLSGSYSANYHENWAHAGVVTNQITGSIKGLSAYDVTVSYINS